MKNLIPSHITIVRTDRLGDVLLTLPLAAAIKHHNNNIKISFVCTEYTAPVVKLSHFIDEVIIYNPANFDSDTQTKFLNTECVLFVTPEKKLSFSAFIGKVPLRVGTSRRWFSFLYNLRVPIRRAAGGKHEAEYNFELLHAVGIEQTPSRARFSEILGRHENIYREMEKKYLEFWGEKLPEHFVIIHPGSGGSSADLPLSTCIQIAQFILSESRLSIVVTGSKSEQYLAEQFPVNNRIRSVCGLLTLPELFTLYTKAGLFLGNSTGTLHLAAAAGIPVVGFFPHSTNCNPVRWGAFSELFTAVTPNTGCSNCTLQECLDKRCMETIQLSDVSGVIQQYLR